MQIVEAKRRLKRPIAVILKELPAKKDRAIEVEKSKVQSVRNAITRLHKSTEMEFETEKIEGNPKKEGWINVWRVR